MLKTLTLRSRQGFTLIELLIMILLVAGGILWLLHTNFTSLRVAREARLRFLITKGVLQYELEFLQDQPYASLAACPWTTVTGTLPSVIPLTSQLPDVQSAIIFNEFRYRISESTPDIRTITVSISWIDPHGRRRIQFLNTLVTAP